MSRRIRIGVFGAGRGQTMVQTLAQHPDAELVAVCDEAREPLARCVELAREYDTTVTAYTDYERFLEHDLDAVVLANYAHEHAPAAIQALNSGRHVVSEVLACQHMAEAVALVEAVERSGCVYAYAENYCYFRGTMEMRRLYRDGMLGEMLHAEGEYVHDCRSAWPALTQGGRRNHWRQWCASTFYITHSLGPILTITGLRPVRVVAMETANRLGRTVGRRGADGAVVLCQMSNGSTAKVLPWSNYVREPGSVWYCLYGTEGMAETDRWHDGVNRLHVYREQTGLQSYLPEPPVTSELASRIAGHGGSDFYTMHWFLQAILQRDETPWLIDVYQALDMTLPGIQGFRSICNGNAPMDIPDLRDPKQREAYRSDTWCPDPALAGPGQPEHPCVQGPWEIDERLYTS